MHEADHQAQKGIMVGQGLGRTSQMGPIRGLRGRERERRMRGCPGWRKVTVAMSREDWGSCSQDRRHAGTGAPHTLAGRCMFYFTKCKIAQVEMLCTLLGTQEGATKGLF